MTDEQIGRILERNREYMKKRRGGSGPVLTSGSQGYRVKGTDDGSVTISSTTGGLGKGTGLYAIKAVDNRSLQNIVYHTDGNSPCITAHDAKGASKVAVKLVDNRSYQHVVCSADGAAPCVVTEGRQKVAVKAAAGVGRGVMVLDGVAYNVRRLTPRECFRLQGFPDGLFERAAAVCSDTQLYRQAGNAVTATVSYEMGKWIMEMEEKK